VNTARPAARASWREHQQAISEGKPAMSTANAAAKTDPASWESRAACLHCDPDLFFPITPSGPALRQIAQAKAVCARCPVRRECLQFALTTHQVHGVWGGTSEEERRLRSCGPDRMPAQVGGGPEDVALPGWPPSWT
jgi:WhiB family transcriptional regulator, redox-sensing transcriptional regulator